MLEVTAAEYLDGYRIKIAFSNGSRGTVNLADALWGPMFEPLRDVRVFRKFELSPILHTIRWENDRDLYLRLLDSATHMVHHPALTARHHVPDPKLSPSITTGTSEKWRIRSQTSRPRNRGMNPPQVGFFPAGAARTCTSRSACTT